jgi:hypothetical protein
MIAGDAQMWPERFSAWRSVFFAACLSAISLWGYWQQLGRDHPDSAAPFMVLVCFLPMCFWMNAEEITRLRKQVKELQRRLDKRSGQEPGSRPAPDLISN